MVLPSQVEIIARFSVNQGLNERRYYRRKAPLPPYSLQCGWLRRGHRGGRDGRVFHSIRDARAGKIDFLWFRLEIHWHGR